MSREGGTPMEGIHFRKYHGLGNDYLVIDPGEFLMEMTPDVIRMICDRNFGPGSDGILHGPFHSPPPVGGIAAPGLRIFNPDGSEAEKSGNGVRIFAAYLVERGLVDPSGFRIATRGGIVGARLMDRDSGLYEIDMGPARFSAALHGLRCDADEFVDKPLSVGGREFRATAVSMGNPHCVLFAPDADASLARCYGPLVENHPMFPERTNVQFLQVLDRGRIRIEIWERGAGYTLASGSSSCGAASVARRLGLVDDEVTVEMPGGELRVAMSDETVLMTGPVRKIYDGRFAKDFLEGLEGSNGSNGLAGGR